MKPFLTPDGGPYVLTHSVGCLPRAARAAVDAGYLQPWARGGGDAWPEWLRGIDGFRGALTELFGGAPAEYCPQSNLSSGLTKLLAALPPSPRRVLLAAEESFPSLGFVMQAADRLGFTTRFLPQDPPPDDLAGWSAALTDDVRAVLVTHVHSNSGRVAPVAEVARLCAARGIFCIVDVAQSAGILPLSFPESGAHAVLGSCVKWLCGGPGAGFLWVRADVLPELQPVDVGWFSHENPFEMDIHSFRYAHDARRFWGGTPSVASYVVATAGLNTIHELGVSSVLAHNRRLIDVFRQELQPAWRLRLPAHETGGTLCVPLGADQPRVAGALRAAGVYFDSRGAVIRLSFHACNDMDDALTVARAWNGAH